MKAEDISKGSLVIINHSKEGGEVVETAGRFINEAATAEIEYI